MSSRAGFLDGTFGSILRVAGEFFINRDPVHATMERSVRSGRSEGIGYAIIDGMAMAGLGLVRVTQVVDVLLTPPGLRKFTDGFADRLDSSVRSAFLELRHASREAPSSR